MLLSESQDLLDLCHTPWWNNVCTSYLYLEVVWITNGVGKESVKTQSRLCLVSRRWSRCHVLFDGTNGLERNHAIWNSCWTGLSILRSSSIDGYIGTQPANAKPAFQLSFLEESCYPVRIFTSVGRNRVRPHVARINHDPFLPPQTYWDSGHRKTTPLLQLWWNVVLVTIISLREKLFQIQCKKWQSLAG